MKCCARCPPCRFEAGRTTPRRAAAARCFPQSAVQSWSLEHCCAEGGLVPLAWRQPSSLLQHHLCHPAWRRVNRRQPAVVAAWQPPLPLPQWLEPNLSRVWEQLCHWRQAWYSPLTPDCTIYHLPLVSMPWCASMVDWFRTPQVLVGACKLEPCPCFTSTIAAKNSHAIKGSRKTGMLAAESPCCECRPRCPHGSGIRARPPPSVIWRQCRRPSHG